MAEAIFIRMSQPDAIASSLITAGQRAPALRCVAPCQPPATVGKTPRHSSCHLVSHLTLNPEVEIET